MKEYTQDNKWNPPLLEYDTLNNMLLTYAKVSEDSHDFLVILRVTPYIDSIHFHYSLDNEPYLQSVNRYVFHEGYEWSSEDEYYFSEFCLQNPRCVY